METLFSRPVALLILLGSSAVCSFSTLAGLLDIVAMRSAVIVATIAVAVMVSFMLAAIAYENRQAAVRGN